MIPLKHHLSNPGALAVRLLLCVAVLYIAVIDAWLIDDAKITFRQVWNFIHGDGMTVNFGERVQAFTHPTWFFLLSAVGFVTRELFITTLVVSIALSLASVMVLLGLEHRLRAASGGRYPLLTPTLLLVFSVSFCDYMSSGLENPLAYFLVALLLWCIAADDGGRRRQRLFILLALLVLTRPDFAALFLPLALVLAATSHGWRGFLNDVWPGALLLTVWTVFALIYFGAPLPNTFYAKMASGYPLDKNLAFGVRYFTATWLQDPAGLLIIAAGVAVSLVRGGHIHWALAAGQILYLSFIIYSGGDWMPSGRFFAVPVFLAVGQMILALADGGMKTRTIRVFTVVLALTALFGWRPSHYPLLATAEHYKADAQFRPSHYRWGLFSMRRSDIMNHTPERPVRYKRNCGMGRWSLEDIGTWHIDHCALTDPFLARLPSMDYLISRMPHNRIAPGHYSRRLPTNYGEFLVGNTEAIADEDLHGLLRDVSLAARAERLFTKERFAAIWRLNSGYHSYLDLGRYKDPKSRIPIVSDDVHFFISLDELSVYKPDGYPVGTLPRFYNTVEVEIGEPRLATRLQLNLTGVEHYRVYVNDELIAVLEDTGDHGLALKNHTVPLPGLTSVETLRIQPLGRHWQRAFTVGHVLLEQD